MGIKFGPAIPKASVAPTPNFSGAAAADSRSKIMAEALRSRQIASAIELYNTGMGKRTPIYDKFNELLGPDEEAATTTLLSDEVPTDDILSEELIPPIPVEDPAIIETATPLNMGDGTTIEGLQNGLNVEQLLEEDMLRKQFLESLDEEDVTRKLFDNNSFDLANILRMGFQ